MEGFGNPLAIDSGHGALSVEYLVRSLLDAVSWSFRATAADGLEQDCTHTVAAQHGKDNWRRCDLANRKKDAEP